MIKIYCKYFSMVFSHLRQIHFIIAHLWVRSVFFPKSIQFHYYLSSLKIYFIAFDASIAVISYEQPNSIVILYNVIHDARLGIIDKHNSIAFILVNLIELDHGTALRTNYPFIIFKDSISDDPSLSSLYNIYAFVETSLNFVSNDIGVDAILPA